MFTMQQLAFGFSLVCLGVLFSIAVLCLKWVKTEASDANAWPGVFTFLLAGIILVIGMGVGAHPAVDKYVKALTWKPLGLTNVNPIQFPRKGTEFKLEGRKLTVLARPERTQLVLQLPGTTPRFLVESAFEIDAQYDLNQVTVFHQDVYGDTSSSVRITD